MLCNSVTFADLPGIGSVLCESEFFGHNSAVNRPTTGGAEAYNYSVHIIWDTVASLYRLYYGGRWKSEGGDGDHVLQCTSATRRPGSWTVADRPEFPQGQEEGIVGEWCSRNCLEPEVVKIGDAFYMYSQVEIPDGWPIDVPGLRARGQGCDRIQLHMSSDARTWRRWSRLRGVIVNVDDPEHTCFDHEEVIFVPWDNDNLNIWLYLHAFNSGRSIGHYRIRSADAHTFDWNLREKTGFPNLGNQIGYAVEAPSGPLFARITFADEDSGRLVPCLHFSHDGIKWTGGTLDKPILLAGSQNNADNKNCYFLGMSTVDGTGRLKCVGPGRFEFIYGASTSNGPGRPEVFKSAIGVGFCLLTLNPSQQVGQPTHRMKWLFEKHTGTGAIEPHERIHIRCLNSQYSSATLSGTWRWLDGASNGRTVILGTTVDPETGHESFSHGQFWRIEKCTGDEAGALRNGEEIYIQCLNKNYFSPRLSGDWRWLEAAEEGSVFMAPPDHIDGHETRREGMRWRVIKEGTDGSDRSIAINSGDRILLQNYFYCIR